MSQLKKLYQQVLLDHNKNPRNFKRIDSPTHYAHGVNPLCGDDYHLFITVSDDIIVDIGFHGTGCAISMSVSSMMTTHLLNQSVTHALTVKDTFIGLLTDVLGEHDDTECLGHLTLFENVKQFPIRVKCATLIWRALEAALTKNKLKITTEA
ncbi:MAG: Fe-S cluster assembly sulfur transfer protein SufU [Candidatus Marinamargulisbacteria bacterium]